MKRSVSYNKLLIEDLKDPKEAAAYINAVLEDGDPQLLLKAMKKVAEARGGMTRLAGKTGVSRMGL